MNGIGIGIPNNNFATGEVIPPEPDSRYQLEESIFNYLLESDEGYYQLEQNYF